MLDDGARDGGHRPKLTRDRVRNLPARGPQWRAQQGRYERKRVRQNLGNEIVEARRIVPAHSGRTRREIDTVNSPERRQPRCDLAHSVLKDELVDRTGDHTTVVGQSEETCVSSAVLANGFSTSVCSPASMSAVTMSTCVASGVQTWAATRGERGALHPTRRRVVPRDGVGRAPRAQRRSGRRSR